MPVTADQLDAALQQAQDSGWSHLDFFRRICLLADQAGLRRERSIAVRLIKDACFRDLRSLSLSEFDWNFNPAIPRPKSKRHRSGRLHPP